MDEDAVWSGRDSGDVKVPAAPGTDVSTPTTPTRRRRAALVALIAGAVAAAVVVTVGIAVATGGSGRPVAHPTAAAAACVTAFLPTPSAAGQLPALQLSEPPDLVPTGGVVAAATAAPGGGGLRVAEVGHSPLPADSVGLYHMSIGAIIENTSGQVAYGAMVTFGALDARGRSAIAPDLDVLQQIPVIMPGQRVGVGVMALVYSDTRLVPGTDRFTDGPVPVARLAVSLGKVRWLPADGTWASVTATAETVTDADRPGLAEARYDAHSPYCRSLAPHGAGVIYRNAAGMVIGGALQPADASSCRPGTTHVVQEMNAAPLPAGTDPGRIEVYPYCDPAPVYGIQLAAPGVPGNY